MQARPQVNLGKQVFLWYLLFLRPFFKEEREGLLWEFTSSGAF